MILPENGSVVVIDDKPYQALPVIKALSKKGISTTYYRGIDESELPETPVQNIRLAIVDLQLFDTDNNPHTIATRIVSILKKLISPDNGPYMLLIWSLKKHQYGESLVKEINKEENKIIPSCTIELEKGKCIEKKVGDDDHLKEFKKSVLNELEKSVEENDLRQIEESIDRNWIINEEAEYEIKPDAITIIEENIKLELKKAGVFHLFVIWENLIKKAAAESIKSVSSVIA